MGVAIAGNGLAGLSWKRYPIGDRKLTQVAHLLFSRSRLLSVYADMNHTACENANLDYLRLELVWIMAKDWSRKFAGERVVASIRELKKLFPHQHSQPAKGLKSKVVATSRLVTKATTDCQTCRLSQATPMVNLYLMGDYMMQRYLASMEGAVLSGKLTAQAIAAAHPRSDVPVPSNNSVQLPTSKPITNAATA
jgi:15-cis-phytoene desaturase